MFSLVGKLLAVSIAGVAPIATIIVATSSTTTLIAPPERQEHKLTREDSGSSPQDSESTVAKKQQELEEKEHNDCQDRNIKVVIQDNQGQKLTVPVTDLSKYKGYTPVDVEYVMGTCSRVKTR